MVITLLIQIIVSSTNYVQIQYTKLTHMSNKTVLLELTSAGFASKHMNSARSS